MMSKMLEQIGALIDADNERATADCATEHKRRFNRLPDAREINAEIRRDFTSPPWHREWDTFMDAGSLYSDGRDVS